VPSRLLREGILTSDRVNQLDAAEEVFYRRLMSKVDDFGLHDARPSILRSFLYPLRSDRVREADISRWIAACEKAGLIALYAHDGKPFLQMLDTEWQTRSEPKCPLPPWGKDKRPAVNSCKQPETGVPVFGDGFGVGDEIPPEVGVPKGVELFDAFWSAYPKKKAKDDAKRAFDKRKPDAALLGRMLAAIKVQCTTVEWQKDKGQFIPYPASWLNDARWEDESEVVVVQPVNSRAAETQRLLAEQAAHVRTPPPAHVLAIVNKVRTA
jgi:hypothetical protein